MTAVLGDDTSDVADAWFQVQNYPDNILLIFVPLSNLFPQGDNLSWRTGDKTDPGSLCNKFC